MQDDQKRRRIIATVAKARSYLTQVKENLPEKMEGDFALYLDDVESAIEISLDAYKLILTLPSLDPASFAALTERVQQFSKDLAAFEFFDDVVEPPSDEALEDSLKKAHEHIGSELGNKLEKSKKKPR